MTAGPRRRYEAGTAAGGENGSDDLGGEPPQGGGGEPPQGGGGEPPQGGDRNGAEVGTRPPGDSAPGEPGERPEDTQPATAQPATAKQAAEPAEPDPRVPAEGTAPADAPAETMSTNESDDASTGGDQAQAAPDEGRHAEQEPHPGEDAHPPDAYLVDQDYPMDRDAYPEDEEHDDGDQARPRSLYVRALRLRHVAPTGWRRNLLAEGSVLVGVLLALTDLTSAWVVIVFPLGTALAVKYHDTLAGLWASDEADEPGHGDDHGGPRDEAGGQRPGSA